MQASPIRPSMDIRAAALAAQHQREPTGTGPNKLEALLNDLDDSREHTSVDNIDKFKRDPISELIGADPRRKEAIVQTKRVPNLDDDDDTPLPAPRAESPGYSRLTTPRPNTRDEAAAMDALLELDSPVKRVENAAEQATAAAAKLEQAAERAEAAVRRSAPMRQVPATPIIDQPPPFEVDPPRLKSRMFGVVLTGLVIAGGIGFYFIYKNQEDAKAEQAAQAAANKKKTEQLAIDVDKDQPDPGAIRVRSQPSQAGVWLKLGRTPLDTLRLSSTAMHELRLEAVEGYQPVDTQVLAQHWTGEGAARKANVSITLQQAASPKALPAMPLKPPDATGFKPGNGPIHLESVPAGAEAWLYIGMTDAVEFNNLQAGVGYELRVLKDGYRPAYITITPDEWRDGGDPSVPINRARKKSVLAKEVTLEQAPAGPPSDKAERPERGDKGKKKKPKGG